MKRWPLGFLLVIAISAHAQSFWDGNAAVQRGDAAFDAGLYAMSNAFTRDTEIVVEDPASGKTTTAKVVGRIDDRLDILVLLSPSAALPLGLAQGEIMHVRVTLRKVEAKDTPILAEDTAPSTDPDRIPAPVAPPTVEGQPAFEVAQAVKSGTSGQTSEETEPSKGSIPAESVTTAVEEEAVVEEAVVEEAVVEEAVVEEAVVEEAVVEEAVVEEAVVEEDPLLAELAARAPQKQLFLPPREDEMFVYQEPVEPPTVEVAEAELVTEETVETEPEAIEVPTVIEVAAEPAEETLEVATLAEPEIASDPGPVEPESAVEPITLVEATPPVEIKPELVETLVAAAPAPMTEPTATLVEPGIAPTAVAVAAEEKPPEEKPPLTDGQTTVATTTETTETTETTATTTATEEPPAEKPPVVVAATTSVQPDEKKPAVVAVVLDLPAKGNLTYYLQLAAYSTEAMAKDTATRLSTTYPVLVLAPPAGTKPLYRVFIGPLNKAESGTLLNQFRHLGFPDAFARTAQN